MFLDCMMRRGRQQFRGFSLPDSDPEFGYGVGGVGGALVVELEVGLERSCMRFRAEGGPGLRDDFPNGSAGGRKDAVTPGGNVANHHAFGRWRGRVRSNANEDGVFAVFVAGVVGVDGEDGVADAMGNAVGEGFGTETLPEVGDGAFRGEFAGVGGAGLDARDGEALVIARSHESLLVILVQMPTGLSDVGL